MSQAHSAIIKTNNNIDRLISETRFYRLEREQSEFSNNSSESTPNASLDSHSHLHVNSTLFIT